MIARVLFLVLLAALPAGADPIRYEVDLSEAATQTLHLRMRLPLEGRQVATVSLPAWRPGKYLILDPAQTVRRLEARSAAGDPLAVEKVAKSTWRIQAAAGAEEAVIEYEIYANSLHDRTRHVDDTHAFLSGSSVFLYDVERLERPVEVRLAGMPEGWRIASGLESAPDDKAALLAPDYHTLVDSPIEAGEHDLLTFEVAGKPHEIAVWGEAEYDEQKLRKDFAAIVTEQHEIFGSLPYDRYVFIMHIAPGIGGGTEHLNSTVLHLKRSSLEDPKAYKRFLGLVSHEMFHTWNVKQLRPAGLVPYDYSKENYTTLLWVAEGTTSYYDDLTLARAGLIGEDEYLDILADSIGDLRDRPGAAVQSLEASSFDAWIKYNRSSPDDVNSTVNFYSKGALVSFLLDLHIRRATDGRVTLDDVMREMVAAHPLSEGGYTRGDLLEAIERLTGTSFADFFDRYVAGTEPLPFEEAVGLVGLKLFFEEEEPDEDERPLHADEQGRPIEPTLGMRVRDEGGRAVVRWVRRDGAAHEAGVIHADEITAINGRRITPDNFGEVESTLAPGEQVQVDLFRRDRLRTITITAGSRLAGEWRLRRVEQPTEQQVAAYESWIGRRHPDRPDAESDDVQAP